MQVKFIYNQMQTYNLITQLQLPFKMQEMFLQ
jgi:hypothetical protein